MLRLFAVAVAMWMAVPCGVTPGTPIREFSPLGMYAGHWGVDYAMEEGTDVLATAGGLVTFAGTIVGVQSVTVDLGGGLRASYSYLSSTSVTRGAYVHPGQVIGQSGVDHGAEALHVSTRVDGRYVDPAFLFKCTTGTVRLMPLDG